MPRRLILSATERDTLLALPESQDDLIRYYTFNDSDLSLIRQRRGDANRLGFAVQLCLLRYPGYALGTDSELPEPVILWVAKQVQAEPASWAKYGERDVTRREHAQELRTYPRQNGLAVALRELGRIERTLFILDWLQSVELRRRVHAGLNKGEARNSLARAVFFNRLGEIRDRSFEQQRYRASGLNLVTAAIVLWNTVYLERATQGLVEAGKPVDGELLQYLSPLGWEHINLTGDYVWRQSRRLEDGKFRPLRLPGKP
ncbi:TPA: Tn3 family transposase [Pseudomonas aeruginosa]|uniref:Tn3 family transposase n=1 Tax=Pseudomonas TaxID=286 RepID=UPI000761C484|nr:MULTISPECIES: Tn3 family transposase [Pseudomonas]NWD57181.1 Tn3 family transposase [Pseudomonas veronii]HCR1541142.1 Tn3 family transposase [Pseudomonas aeruginosa]